MFNHFFTNHPVHWPWCGFAMNLSLIPPYLLLVIACNACACCVICGNCLAIDWHNALAACGLQRKAPVVSQLFRAENWWEKRVASWAQKERMNFWANSPSDNFFWGSGTAHYHPTCIPSPWAFLQLCREWLKITTVTMVAFLPQVFFHLLTGSSTTSPGITPTKCKVPRGTTWDQKDGIQHGNKNDRFFHELMKWMQTKPNKNPSSHWPLSNISLGAFLCLDHGRELSSHGWWRVLM